MAGSVFGHEERAPRARVHGSPAEAVFFPGEVARLLKLDGVDYAQLRRLYKLARELRGGEEPTGRGWARFTLADLAATEVLIQLGGGREALEPGRRLILGDVHRACEALRAMGFEDPLFQVPMGRLGRRIVARIGQHVIEPTSGQLALSTAGEMVDSFLSERLITDRRVRSAIGAERRRVQPPRRKKILHTGFSPLSEIVG